ncbi:MAG: DUF4271 domain-containing protein [Bacteroidetes bacterium]|nr:DUF4271 domain-containing protein [Bacteroidota bacterium]
MQSDSNTYYSMHDSTNASAVFFKPIHTKIISKSDSLQLQADSLNLKYFFTYHNTHFSVKKDSIFEPTRASMLTANQLHAAAVKPLANVQYTTDWIIIIFILSFSLFAWILSFSRKRLKQIFKATYANRTINQLIRDGDLFKERLAFPFIIIYFSVFSLFIFQCAHFFLNLKQWGFFSLSFYIRILFIIIALHYVKQFVTKFIGNLFKNNNTAYIYQLNDFVFKIIIGIFLLPALLFSIYSASVISSFTTYLCIIFVVVLYIFKLFRAALIGLSYSKFSHFYLFLYLCTLEILPILIIAKIISGMIISKL